MPNELEIIVLEIHENKQKPYLLVNWYRPPSSIKKSQVFQLFEDLLELLDRHEHNILILGDINCDMLNLNQWPTKRLMDIIDNYKLVQLISEPTRVTMVTQTLLDLILVNDKSIISSSGVIHMTASDHYLVYCVKGRTNKVPQFHKYRFRRNIAKIHEQKFKDLMLQSEWGEIETQSSPLSAYTCLESKLNNVLDKLAPSKNVRVKNKSSPWMTEEILTLICERNNAKKQAKESGLDADWKKYKNLRNSLTYRIRLLKKEYVGNCINMSIDKNVLWASMKPFLPNKQKSSNNIPSVRVNGDLIQDIKQIVNEYNRYFVSVGTSIQQEVDQPKENAFEDYLSIIILL